MEKKRKNYNTTINVDMMKKLKILAIEKDCKINVLLEEAISDLLNKHSAKASKKVKS